jgi:hypothetical protein
MDAASWNTASADVKASIISRADPYTARSLCTIDRKSREICRDRLPVQDKYRICLNRVGEAIACDKIPIFSQR